MYISNETRKYYHDNVSLMDVNRYNHYVVMVFDNGNILHLYKEGFVMYDPFYQSTIDLSLKDVYQLLF